MRDTLGASAESAETRFEVERAREFLEEELKDGLVPSAELIELASEAGISDSTLQRARKLLGVRSKKAHGNGSVTDETPTGEQLTVRTDRDGKDLEPAAWYSLLPAETRNTTQNRPVKGTGNLDDVDNVETLPCLSSPSKPRTHHDCQDGQDSPPADGPLSRQGGSDDRH